MWGVAADDLDKLRVDPKTADYHERDLSQLMRKTRYVGEAVQTYRQRANGLRCIVFCVDVAHVHAVAEEYRKAGIACETTTAKTPHGERRAILDRFRRGETTVLINCDVYTEGFDEPLIGAVQVLRPTRSLSRWLQAAGRGLRPVSSELVAECRTAGIPVPDKRHLILLDHGGNVHRHGSPLDAREWTLEGHDTSAAAEEAREEAAASRVSKCPSCDAIVLRGQVKCANCGAALSQRAAQAVAGMLVRLLSGGGVLAPGQEPSVVEV
jgi:superfamily II DNA or RNA helicase